MTRALLVLTNLARTSVSNQSAYHARPYEYLLVMAHSPDQAPKMVSVAINQVDTSGGLGFPNTR